MGSLKFKSAILAVLLWAAVAPPGARPENTEALSLYSGSVAQGLAQAFPDRHLSYVLLDASNGRVIASRWPSPAVRVPIGSLAKPFTALAYAQSHGFQFPEHECKGHGTCWWPRGHGNLGLVQAVAQSCNSYFASLAQGVSAGDMIAITREFGLRGPGAGASPEALVGRFGIWRESPVVLARAYLELLRRRAQPGTREISEGMLASAKEGTAQGISTEVKGFRVFAKTGTAACSHSRHGSGDGFTAAAWPSDEPRYLLLVRLHGKPGAHTAVVVGKMIHFLEQSP